MKGRIAALVAAAAATVGAVGAATWAKRRTGAPAGDPGAKARGSVAPGTEQSPLADDVPPVNPDLASDPPASASAPAASRDTGSGDDLTAIRGLGKVKAARLADAGVSSYAQMAAWSDDDITEIGLRISTSPGQIKREDWVGQARSLLEGR